MVGTNSPTSLPVYATLSDHNKGKTPTKIHLSKSHGSFKICSLKYILGNQTYCSSSMASLWKPFFGTFIFESVLWCFCVPFEASKLQSLFIGISCKAATRTLYKKPCLCPVEENKSYSFTMTRGWVKDVHFLGEL